jgi:hypothetical protein
VVTSEQFIDFACDRMTNFVWDLTNSGNTESLERRLPAEWRRGKPRLYMNLPLLSQEIAERLLHDLSADF